ncbi:hypothetical protein DSBG_1821 [Desulfosporosinus sp. BG]|nr:hypothetical protein DSBG_1821 [Desulfosporosinus sp. BG]
MKPFLNYEQDVLWKGAIYFGCPFCVRSSWKWQEHPMLGRNP